LLFWSTLDDLSAIAQPAVGSGYGSSAAASAVFQLTANGRGAYLGFAGDEVRFVQRHGPTINLDPRRGTADFCYQPLFDHQDGSDHGLFGFGDLAGRGLIVGKLRVGNDDRVRLVASDGTHSAARFAAAQAFSFTAGTTYRISVFWSLDEQVPSLRLFIDGAELSLVDEGTIQTLTMPAPSESAYLFIGAEFSSNYTEPRAVFDELYIYDHPFVPN
jgi:hypothetical protein